MQKLNLEKLSVDTYLNLDTFLDDLEPSEYINRLSRDIAELDRKQNQHSQTTRLNPAPYIKVFSQLQTKLNDLMDDCKRKKQVLESSVSEKEQTHYQNVIQQASDASNIQSKFNELSSIVDKLSISKTEPLGEKLNKVNKTKDNSINIIKITKAYNSFYTSSQPTTDLMKKNETSAIMLNQLLVLSSKLVTDEKLPRAKPTHELIKKFGDDFESDLLESFHSKYRAKLYDQLHATTKCLFAYNNGVNIVEYFVKNHPFFAQFQDQNQNQNVDTDWLHRLSDPYFDNYQIDESAKSIFDEVKTVLISQIEPITKAFYDHSDQVFVLFISQTFDTILGRKIEAVLNAAFKMNELSYLRALELYATEIYESIVLELKSAFENDNRNLGAEVENIYTNLFQKYFKNESYFKLEKSSLEHLIDQTIAPFISQHNDVIKKQLLTERIELYKEQQENDVNEEEVEGDVNINGDEQSMVSDSRSNNFAGSSKLTMSSRAMAKFEFYLPDSRSMKEKFKNARQRMPRSKRLKKFVSKVPFMKSNEKNDNFSIMGFSNNQSSGVLSDKDTQLSLETSEKIYKFVIESLNRATGLVPSQMTQYTMVLYDLLLNKVGPSYISVGLASLYHNFIYPFQPGFRSRSISELDVNFLSQFETISLQLYIMSVIIQRSFYPLLANNLLLNKISISFNGYIQDVEIGMNIIIDEIVKLIESHIDTILKAQPLNDYSVPMNDCSSTCDQLCKFLENVLQSIQNGLKFSSVLKMGVISRISTSLLNSLIIQFTKFQFNSYGITTLANDAVQYLSLFNVLKAGVVEINAELNNGGQYNDDDDDDKLFKEDIIYESNRIEDIQKAYQILNDLPGFFNSTSLQQLRDFANEGRLKYLRKEVLDKFVQKRINYSTNSHAPANRNSRQ